MLASLIRRASSVERHFAGRAVDDAPVFVIAPHRSRSTLLQRVLNAHPDLVIWGEHGGLINKLAELDATAAYFWNVDRPLADRNLRQLTDKSTLSLASFDPWTSPWDRAAFRDTCRKFLRKTFRRGLQSSQRWGLKEIRYNSPQVCEFIATLFPRAKFIIVQRSAMELCISSLLCDWSIKYLNEVGAASTPESAEAVLGDCCYAVATVEWQLEETARTLEARAMVVESSDISKRVDALFGFLGLGLNPRTRIKIDEVLGERLGRTDKQRSVGIIDRAFIEANAPRHLAEARQEIVRDGLDMGRLRRTSERGAYSFLAGDHDVRSSNLSTMFW